MGVGWDEPISHRGWNVCSICMLSMLSCGIYFTITQVACIYVYIYISCHSMCAPILYLAEVLWMCRMNSPTKLCIQFAPLVQLRFRHWSLLHPASARRHLRRLGLRGVTTIEIQDSTPKPIRMSWSECHRHEWPHIYTHILSYVYICILLYISRFVDANMLIVSLYHDQNTGIPGAFPLCKLHLNFPNQSGFKDLKIP